MLSIPKTTWYKIVLVIPWARLSLALLNIAEDVVHSACPDCDLYTTHLAWIARS
jgi:hypothetical protein